MARFTRRQRGGLTADQLRAGPKAAAAAAAAKTEVTPAKTRENIEREAEKERKVQQTRYDEYVAAKERNANIAAKKQAIINARAAEIEAIRVSHLNPEESNIQKEVDKLGAYPSFTRALKMVGTPKIKAALIQKLTSMPKSGYEKLRNELKQNNDELVSILDGLSVIPKGVNAPVTVYTPKVAPPSYSRIYNAEGFDQDGFNANNRNRQGVNRDGYNVWGFDKYGLNKNSRNGSGIVHQRRSQGGGASRRRARKSRRN